MTSQFSKLPRCAFSALVLLGAVTTVFACTAGGNDTKEETVGVTEQGLNWEGGCACMPVEECPTLVGSQMGGACKYPASQGQDACSATLECKPGAVNCYIRKDGNECTVGGPVGKCDGGYCGTCPTCYYETPKGVCAADNKEAVCGTVGKFCEKDCRDSNECTKDTCSLLSGCTNAELPDGTTCASGTCYLAKCCTGCFQYGACEEGFKETACGTGGAECKICDDGNPCTTDYCDGTGCRTVPVTVGTSCADSNRCNGTETCNGSGVCRPGTAVICTVTDPCFSYACNPATGACDRTPLTGPTCSDGSVCTETDTCQSGVCIGTGTKNCSDGNDCTDDACDAVLGCQHSKLVDGHICNDGSLCTVGETCQNGTCTSPGGVSCNDNNPCTVDTYDCVNTKCVYTPSNEGGSCVSNVCLTNTTCKSGVCQGGTALSCDDYNPCTDDSCSSTAGGCLYLPAVSAGTCSDNNPCTENDQCNATGSCTGTIRVCPPLDECHLSGTCNLTSGACENDPRKPDGAPCAQGNGACSSGVCLLTSGTGGTSAGGASGIGGMGQGGIGGIGQGGSGGTNSAATSAAGGAPSSGGAATGGTNDAGGKSSGQSSVADAGAAGSDGDDTGDLYQRNPGGCSCSLPARDSRGWGWLLSLLAGVSILRFRQRKN